jgi:hypothetical protein
MKGLQHKEEKEKSKILDHERTSIFIGGAVPDPMMMTT